MTQIIDYYLCGKCKKKFSKDELNNELEIDDKELKNSKDDEFYLDFCNLCKKSLSVYQVSFLDDDFFNKE